MNAVCFSCGSEKSAAIKLCTKCKALPTSHEDRVVSVCLSIDCLRSDNLRIASRYMEKKGRLPGFHDKVIKKAEKIVGEMPDEFQVSQSFEIAGALVENLFVLDD